eukprot:TRINITY_DN60690_c0_g1_i1.p4 TRINITY_DN60690_c0_g1~~TRINITY_DN60690_c0_g1_i1.p4  ORF type:complete len:106 (-),score=17.62 TRINITY_DN60690_c0_g1_i1:246-563(-)
MTLTACTSWKEKRESMPDEWLPLKWTTFSRASSSDARAAFQGGVPGKSSSPVHTEKKGRATSLASATIAKYREYSVATKASWTMRKAATQTKKRPRNKLYTKGFL